MLGAIPHNPIGSIAVTQAKLKFWNKIYLPQCSQKLSPPRKGVYYKA